MLRGKSEHYTQKYLSSTYTSSSLLFRAVEIRLRPFLQPLKMKCLTSVFKATEWVSVRTYVSTHVRTRQNAAVYYYIYSLNGHHLFLTLTLYYYTVYSQALWRKQKGRKKGKKKGRQRGKESEKLVHLFLTLEEPDLTGRKRATRLLLLLLLLHVRVREHSFRYILF